MERAAFDRSRAELAAFKQPTELIVVDDLPKATLNKVARTRWRDLLREGSAGSTNGGR